MAQRKALVLMSTAAFVLGLNVGTSHAACSNKADRAGAIKQQQSRSDKATNAKSPQEIVGEMVENASEAPSGGGGKYVGSGPAKPVENWFGCKPGNKKCLSEKGQAQMEDGKEHPDPDMAETSSACDDDNAISG